jgi:N-acetylglucosaminyldiphosphoundecaprenol N-acetyl-beta-D-mannosaminyltransferase
MDVQTIRVNVLGVGINATSMQQAVDRLIETRRAGGRGYVCVTSVHGVMESQRDPELKKIHNASLMTVPDGMPTVWMGREYGFIRMGRVYGPDLMLNLCKATSTGEPFTHFLYGATEQTLHRLKVNLEKHFPGIRIVGSFAPPFRPLTKEEELDFQRRVAECKPDFLWVGLSTPKQERFMFAHCANVSVEGGEWKVGCGEQHSTSNIPQFTEKYPLDCGIMIGVGAAFDIHAGNYKDAPEWIKTSGLQWLYRLCKEPRRLWRRYLWIVPGFIWLSFLQVMGLKRFALTEDQEL